MICHNLRLIGNLTRQEVFLIILIGGLSVLPCLYAPAETRYVNMAHASPAPPYLTWATAATNIQDAINAAIAGDVVLVTNGVYRFGGKTMNGISNRVCVDKSVVVRSVYGPSVTTIQGEWDPTSTNGLAAVRCVWLASDAVLEGFTLSGGATRSLTGSLNESMYGGGVFGASTNARVSNCVLIGNYAAYIGGGAYRATLDRCVLTDNHAFGSGQYQSGTKNGGSGGGAASCFLRNCLLTGNIAHQSYGGGAYDCTLVNCGLRANSSPFHGSALYVGSMVNCTVVGNVSTDASGFYGDAVYQGALTNCVVWGNLYRTGAQLTNYADSALSYCCAQPLAPGLGNISIDPALIPGSVHLTASSQCLGAGDSGAVQGSDIDGQSWAVTPAIGCDEWHPAPVIAVQPGFRVSPRLLAFSAVFAGLPEAACSWEKDDVLIQDGPRHANSTTTNLLVKDFGPEDAGAYRLVVSNEFGFARSEAAHIVVHAVDVNCPAPVAPYPGWGSAANSIQDAIDVASAGGIVLVTNGVYSDGGKVLEGDITNRVALDKAVTVISVNGAASTVIEGRFDPVSTNGPGAIRCAYVAPDAELIGFTLRNGATRANGGTSVGGGVLCSTNGGGAVSNCILTNNSARWGGGMAWGTINNSLIAGNVALYASGAYLGSLNNCTVVNNVVTGTSPTSSGAVALFGTGVTNSIVRYNVATAAPGQERNYYTLVASFRNSCTFPLPSGQGNIAQDPQLLDGLHISATSPCRGAGDALYANGTDIDGDPWATPPSMGCDEVILSNLSGPLSVRFIDAQGTVFLQRTSFFKVEISGKASVVVWSFSDNITVTNGASITHQWSSPGDYTVTSTAYNNDNPQGVAASTNVHVVSLAEPQIEAAVIMPDGLQFEFASQAGANYTVQYTTNLVAPVTWKTLKSISNSTGEPELTLDPAVTNGSRFYRVLAF